MRRIFACSTSPKGKGGEAAPLGRLRLWKTSSIDYVVFLPPILFESGSILVVVQTSFRFDRWEWDIFLSCNVSSRNTLHLHMGVNCFLSFSIKWIEMEEELIVSLVLINFWKRSWVVCCSSLFTEEALIGLEILVSSLHALFLILHRFEEYEWYL